MWWEHTGSQYKSAGETQRLVDHVILDERFNKEELRGFSASKEHKRLDDFNASGGNSFTPETGWREGTVTLTLPKAGVPHDEDNPAPTVEVSGIWYRDLLDTLVAACQAPNARDLHWWPSELFRQDPNDPEAPPERLYTDFCNSPAFLREHEAIQNKPRHPEDPPNLEYAVVPILAQSDSTRLANFGEHALWPIYLWILSKCKYMRVLPSAFMAMHLAYVPHVSPHPLTHGRSLIPCLALQYCLSGIQRLLQRRSSLRRHSIPAPGTDARNIASPLQPRLGWVQHAIYSQK